MGDRPERVQDGAEVAVSETAPKLVARVFRNRFGHWRAGWRLAVYVVAVFVIGKSMSAVLKIWMSNPAEASFTSWHHAVLWVLADVALVGAGLVALRWFDRRPTALLGLGFGPGWIAEAGIGLAGGALLSGTLTAVLLTGGWVTARLSPDVGASLASLPRLLFIFAAAASVEELVFRGYPLQVLAEGSRRWIAGLVLCLLFAWGHAGNPDVTVVGIANIFLAAVLLTVLYFQTRRLWLPIALHLSWNLAQSWLWGFDVSGIAIDDRLLVVATPGPELLTGGGFGLEGSVLTALLFAALTAWLLVGRPLAPAPRVANLWSSVPRGFGLPPESGGDDAGAAEGVAPAGDGSRIEDGVGSEG